MLKLEIAVVLALAHYPCAFNKILTCSNKFPISHCRWKEKAKKGLGQNERIDPPKHRKWMQKGAIPRESHFHLNLERTLQTFGNWVAHSFLIMRTRMEFTGILR